MPGITFRVGISSSGSAGKCLSLSLCMRAATISVWSVTTTAAAGVGAGVMSQRRLMSKRSWISARAVGSSISDTRKILKSRSGGSFFVQCRHCLKPFVMRSVTHALQYSCFSQHGGVTMLSPLCPAVCLQTGQVVLNSVSCSLPFFSLLPSTHLLLESVSCWPPLGRPHRSAPSAHWAAQLPPACLAHCCSRLCRPQMVTVTRHPLKRC